MATVRADPYDVTLVPVARFADATPVNVVVLSGADATYLVDAGAGPVGHWGPCPGLPEPVLAALGITRLSGLIVTHWDWDHCGGLVDGPWGGPLVPRFPEIPVHVLDEELAFWRARSDGEEAANCGTAVLAVLESAGLLRPVRDGVEVAPGITLRSIPGHSPGQAMVMLGDGAVVFGADLIHEAIHVTRPEDDHQYDHDAALGLATRHRELPRLAASGALVAFTHVDGWGRVIDDEVGLRWQPEEEQ